MKEVIEFQVLQFNRDQDYFNDGYMSYTVKTKKNTYNVSAIYKDTELYENAETKDYTSGIKGFEVQDSKYNKIATIKVKSKSKVVSLEEVEKFIQDYEKNHRRVFAI